MGMWWAMGLYEITETGLKEREVAQFAALGLYERSDLQRLLRDKIEALGEDLLVIAEEFGEWEDARRRIDLLAIDKVGRLVVIELKRTDDGGHMELQALRYAAMVSSMQFEEVVATYARHLSVRRPGEDVDARAELEAFLADGDSDEPTISSDVRIILVSADFGREITTAVLWLNRFDGMDIRCVRLVPYDMDGQVLLDIQQVLPLPEAADYQVKLRRKEAARERSRTGTGRDLTRFHIVVDGTELPAENKRNAMRVMIESLAQKGVPLAEIKTVLSPAKLRVVAGEHEPGQPTRDALKAAFPEVDPNRFFCDSPFVERGQTYVLSNQWGTKTELRLETLSKRFPDAKVEFKRAD